MPLTKDFRETIRERAQREPRFRKALLREAIELMLSGDEKTGRAICGIISTPQSDFVACRMPPLFRPIASCGCLGQMATLRPRICLGFSLIFRRRKA